MSSPIAWFQVGKFVANKWEKRQERKAVVQERQDRIEHAQVESRIKRLETGDNHAASIDMLFVQNAETKRDVMFYTMFLPCVLVFLPFMRDPIFDGFTALEQLPMWYKYTLLGMFISIWGLRQIVRQLLERRLERMLSVAGVAQAIKTPS